MSLVLNADRNEVEEIVQDIRLAFDGDRRLAMLELVVESLPATTPLYPAATTVAVRLTQKAAMKLLIDLHVLSAKMGWPLQEVVGQPAEFQRFVRTTMRRPGEKD